MKALLQRVSSASVEIDGKCVGQIGQGLLVLLGIAQQDDPAKANKLADRLLGYRVFADDSGRMNCSIKDIQGELLVVSQFTLCADTSKGLRPGFSTAAAPELAENLYQTFVDQCRQHLTKVETGVFGADMQVALINDGPVTFMLEN